MDKGHLNAKKELPQDQTDRLVREFLRVAPAIGKVTRPADYTEFEKGLYGYLFVKPISRISNLLSVDRELLVLFSSFESQQPRTLETAIRIIDDSDSRLERSAVIIVHNDPEGDFKLKNWGRERGISIIPLCGQSSLPSGDALEKVLFGEFFSNDVFDVSGPVSDDAKFYGRRSEALDLARQLQAGQVRASLGIRKIGKTSIIHRILDVVKSGHDCSCVMVDCSRDTIWSMTGPQLLSALSFAVGQAVSNSTKYASVQQINDMPSIEKASDQLLQAARMSPRPVLVFFDEIDYITPGSPTSDRWKTQFNVFWRNLRAIYQEAKRSGAQLSLFVGGVSSKWFREESIDGVENAALAFVPEEYLSPLPTGASVAMIRTLSRIAGLQIDVEVATSIAESCSNLPYWIRKACSYIHRRIPIEQRPYTLQANEASALVQSFIETEGGAIANVALSHLFRVYPELEPAALSVQQGDENLSASYGLILERYGVVTRRGGAFRLYGEMMTKGLQAYVERKASHRSGTGASSLEFGSLEDWAEELALLGATRNKIEKRLRGIVLNFLRLDGLQNKQKPSLHDRLCRCIEENRRSSLSSLSPDDVVEKFLWSDLCRLIEMEWLLFAAVFPDKKLFHEHCQIVNQRFDAHAKDADRADVALYRRALDWLNTCLSKV